MRKKYIGLYCSTRDKQAFIAEADAMLLYGNSAILKEFSYFHLWRLDLGKKKPFHKI
jgi:hypothetical protein